MTDRRMEPCLCPGLQPVSLAHENPWFRVMQRGSYFTIEGKQRHVVVLPVVEGTHLVLVQAKRPIVNDVTWELPAGCIEAGETPTQGAQRELREETGITVAAEDRFVALPPVSVSPGRNPALVYVFQVALRPEEFQARVAHDDEIEAVALLSFDRVREMMCAGTMYVATPMAIISRYWFDLQRSDA